MGSSAGVHGTQNLQMCISSSPLASHWEVGWFLSFLTHFIKMGATVNTEWARGWEHSRQGSVAVGSLPAQVRVDLHGHVDRLAQSQALFGYPQLPWTATFHITSQQLLASWVLHHICYHYLKLISI